MMACRFAVIPSGLNWFSQVLVFLQGAFPVFAMIIGIIAIFVGIADFKDKSEVRKEEEDVLVEALKRLREAGEVDLVQECAGDGDRQHQHRVNAELERRGPQQHVRRRISRRANLLIGLLIDI